MLVDIQAGITQTEIYGNCYLFSVLLVYQDTAQCLFTDTFIKKCNPFMGTKIQNLMVKIKDARIK